MTAITRDYFCDSCRRTHRITSLVGEAHKTVNEWINDFRFRAGSGVVSPTAPTPHAGAVGVETTPDVRRRASGQLSG